MRGLRESQVKGDLFVSDLNACYWWATEGKADSGGERRKDYEFSLASVWGLVEQGRVSRWHVTTCVWPIVEGQLDWKQEYWKCWHICSCWVLFRSKRRLYRIRSRSCMLWLWWKSIKRYSEARILNFVLPPNSQALPFTLKLPSQVPQGNTSLEVKN